jgi:hypothetical protein
MRTAFLSTILAAAALCGCATPSADGTGAGQQVADRGERTLGTLFPQKDKNRPTNSITANVQEMENQRIMQAANNPTLK